MRLTKLLPVTVEFDGCFCSDECDYYALDCESFDTSTHEPRGHPFRECKQAYKFEWMDVYIRTRWCCETFGMGEEHVEVVKPHSISVIQAAENLSNCLYELETMDAKDAEALRRLSNGGSNGTSS